MTVRQTIADPDFILDEERAADALGAFAKNQGITTQLAWTTFVNALTFSADPTVNSLLRVLFRSLPRISP